MFSKVLKIGNQMVIVLPEDALHVLGIQEGDVVFVDMDREKGQIVIRSAETLPAGAEINDAFARQVSEFIETYRPALQALAEANRKMP
jgi:bifunctional DNA-binding transcriptional regulator/antitoxin component of YhaV-PrlF toxin-antitoxin module